MTPHTDPRSHSDHHRAHRLGAAFDASRRSFLRVGMVGALGLTLDGYLRRVVARADEPRTGAPPAKADGVIHIFLPGGMSAQETFDPKPYAPFEYKGDFNSIATKITGERMGELLPLTAQIADRLLIVRSMTHGEAAHERGTHNMFTGYRPSPALLYPSIGSVVGHQLGGRRGLPPYVCVPTQPNLYAGSGYLSTEHAPFAVGDEPEKPQFQVKDLATPAGIDAARLDRRRGLRALVDEHFAALEKTGEDELAAMDAFYAKAYALIGSPEARAAFDLAAEPAALRDRYGRHAAGQRMILARRLIEAGVRFVSLSFGGWDMHDKITDGMRAQLPPFDQAFSALIADLEQRGLLDRTLVLVTTEFGRTPKLNATGGRDHWPKVYSIAMAGGGLARGKVYGASDATATDVETDPLEVGDWAATIYHLLGIDHTVRLLAPGDRPIDIVRDGSPRTQLLA